jgi:hypothetical protein
MDLAVEIVLAAIASWRGWGAGPFLIIVGAFALKLLAQLATGNGLEGLMQALDVAVIVGLVIMGLKGRKKPQKAKKR